MATYYPRGYWQDSLPQRVREAEQVYLRAKDRLDSSRKRFRTPQHVKVTIGESVKHIDVWTGEVTLAPPQDVSLEDRAQRELRRGQYLLDLKWYLVAKAEYERLRAEEESGEGHQRSSRPSRSPEPDEEQERRLVQTQARARLRDATDRARKEMTRDSVVDMLTAMAESQRDGLDEDAELERAAATACEVADKLERDAERTFRSVPTVENWKKWLVTAAESQAVGNVGRLESKEGLRRLRPAGPYVTELGDSLSKIAEKFYGDQSRWPDIYIDNYGSVPLDPNLVLPGTTLQIP